MKIPTWAIVVGIFLVLFGGCGVSKSVQAIYLPEILTKQKELIEEMSDTEQGEVLDSLDQVLKTAVSDSIIGAEDIPETYLEGGIKEIFSLSDFTMKWTVRFGYLGVPVAILLLLSGIFLFLRKRFSIKLVYTALIISILFAGIQTMVLSLDPDAGFIARSSAMSNLIGLFLDVILLIVVITMDKSEYLPYTNMK